MEPGPGLTRAEAEALFKDAADPAIAFLYDDKVRDALVAQLRELTGCSPVWVRLGLWAMQQAAAGVAADGTQWLAGKAGVGIARLVIRFPGVDRLVRGLRQLLRGARGGAAFREEIVAIARGDHVPDLSQLPSDAPDDIKLALRLLKEVGDLTTYLPGEFDALHAKLDELRGYLAHLERIERLFADAMTALRQQYEARIAGLEQQQQIDRDTIGAQNAALRALADRVEQVEPAPRIEDALEKVSQGDTREAETLLAEIGDRKVREHSRHSEKGRRAAVEAAEAFRHQGALAQSRSIADAIVSYRRAVELDPNHCWTWVFLCRLELEAGHLAAAEHAAVQARNAAREERDLAASMHELGDVRQAQGDLAGALRAYSEGCSLFERLTTKDQNNLQAKSDIATSWDKIGDVHRYQGDLDLAFEAYCASQLIILQLTALNPGDTQSWRDLSVISEKLGSTLLLKQDIISALQAFRKCNAIRQDLVRANPSSAGLRRDLMVSWNKLGNTWNALDKPARTLRAYRKGKHIAEQLVSSDPHNLLWQRDLGVSWERLSNFWIELGDLTMALENCHKCRLIGSFLVAADPANSQWQRDSALSWNRLGQVQERQGDIVKALQSYDQSKPIHERLAASDPTNAQWQRDLLIWHHTRAEILATVPGRAAEAPVHWAEALRIARPLAASARLAPIDPDIIQAIEHRLARTKES